MSTIIDLMLAVRERCPIFYHRDTKRFDYFPYSQKDLEDLDPNAIIPYKNSNDIALPSYEEIAHKEIMRFYVKEFVEDKEIRNQLFNILRRNEYMDAYLEKLRELNLYDDFIDACGNIYIQIFDEWADKNKLEFK